MNTAQPRVYEFTHPKCAEEPTRYRVVVDSNGAAIERFAGIDRLGGERWIWHDLLEDDINDVAGSVVLAVEPAWSREKAWQSAAETIDRLAHERDRARCTSDELSQLRESACAERDAAVRERDDANAARLRAEKEVDRLLRAQLVETEQRLGQLRYGTGCESISDAHTLALRAWKVATGIESPQQTPSLATATRELMSRLADYPETIELLATERDGARRRLERWGEWAATKVSGAPLPRDREWRDAIDARISEIAAARDQERERAEQAEATAATLRADYSEAKREASEAREAAAEVEPWVWSDDDTAKSVETLADRAVVRITGGHLRALIRGAVEQRVAEALERIGESAGAADEGDEDDVGEPGADVRAAYWRGRSEAFAESITVLRSGQPEGSGEAIGQTQQLEQQLARALDEGRKDAILLLLRAPRDLRSNEEWAGRLCKFFGYDRNEMRRQAKNKGVEQGS